MSIESKLDQTSTSVHLPPPGTVIADRFRIVEMVGRGGMGVVFRAVHINLQKEMAVKMLLDDIQRDDANYKRFHTEARIASMLDHPNIVRVHDFGILGNGYPYLAMDFLAGRSLDDDLKQTITLNLDRFRTIFLQACDALEHAHQEGVIHRDIKPSNIMLVQRHKQPDFVKIVDFGLVKVKSLDGTDQKLTSTNTLVGSPLFMSPEQCRGLDLDARSDIYSLGCVMYRALTGALPIVGDNALDTLYKHVSEQPLPMSKANPRADIPPQLECLVMKALCKTPDARQQSMAELRDELERAMPGEAIHMPLSSTKVQMPSQQHQQPLPFPAPSVASRLRESAFFRAIQPTPPKGTQAEARPTPTGNSKWGVVALALTGLLGFGFFLAAMKQKPAAPRMVAPKPVASEPLSVAVAPVTPPPAPVTAATTKPPAAVTAATSKPPAAVTAATPTPPTVPAATSKPPAAVAAATPTPSAAVNVVQALAPLQHKPVTKPPAATTAPKPKPVPARTRTDAAFYEREGAKLLAQADIVNARANLEQALKLRDDDKKFGPLAAASMPVLADLIEACRAVNDQAGVKKYFYRFCACWTAHPNSPLRDNEVLMKRMIDIALPLSKQAFNSNQPGPGNIYKNWAFAFARRSDYLTAYAEDTKNQMGIGKAKWQPRESGMLLGDFRNRRQGPLQRKPWFDHQ